MLTIGIGNPARGDDAAGLEVVRRLGVSETVLEHDGEPASLISLWEGHEDVVLIDAVSSGRPPGSLVEIDVVATGLPAGLCRSTHVLGPADAVELARALGRLPPRMRLYGIEGSDYSFGGTLSPDVAATVDELVACLRATAPTAG